MSTVTWVTGRRRRWSNPVKYTLLGLLGIPWVLLPFWMLLVNSFKTEAEAGTPSVALPTTWAALDNYTTVFQQGGYLTALGNSVIVAIPTVLAVILLGTMAAWSFARAKAMPLRVFYYLIALSILLPPAIVPTVVLLTRTGLTSTVAGYVLALIGTRVGVMVFLATGYVRSLPIDYEEAAQLDGASRWRTFWHVILPLLRPVIFTAAVMTIINVWNDFFFALYMLKGVGNATLPLSLYTFANAGQYGVRWNLVFAYVIVASLPLLLAYIVLQRKVMSGLTEGGVTG
jgi:raffinose/stachyose/melibiose transport system permease protein